MRPIFLLRALAALRPLVPQASIRPQGDAALASHGVGPCRKPAAWCVAGRRHGKAPRLHLHTADTFWRRAAGLFLHRSLGPHEGLWLRPCRAIHTVGMWRAIDVVFLDRQGNVVKTVHGMRPNRIACCWRAHSVVELPAHYCRRHACYSLALRIAMATRASAAESVSMPG